MRTSGTIASKSPLLERIQCLFSVGYFGYRAAQREVALAGR